MPTAMPSPSHGPMRAQQAMLLRIGLWLALLLSLPIVALFALDGLLWLRCTTTIVANGVLENRLEWRIERRQCAASAEPFFDVLIGLPGKSATPALLARGEPRPVGVTLVDGTPVVSLSGPISGSGQADIIPLRLRRSGSPAVRVDLEQLKHDPAARSGGKF